MPIVDSGTVKFCTDCRTKFDPEVSGSAEVCPHCKGKGIPEMPKPEVKVKGRGK